jgi:hypothetical protein
MPALKNGLYVEDIMLDRIPDFDQASRAYPIAAALTSEQQKTPVTKYWSMPDGAPVLDQGQEGACVGFGITNELRCTPVPIPGLDAVFAKQKIYWPAQEGDPWPGGSYPGATPTYEGTSVHAGIKVAKDDGYYGVYRWGFSEPEMALGLSYLGPAVIGINWYSGMYQPNSKGFLKPTGDNVGGHCILVCGLDVKGKYYTLYNSWGADWGNNGTAKVSRTDMAKLLKQDGECAIITDRYAPGTTTQS